MIKYSIIIATFNRLNELKELLPSVQLLDFEKNNFEIVIVDDGSTDDTAKWIAQYSSTSELNIQYLSQQNQGPGEARNFGMRKSRGAYFIYVDSDCILPSTWLRNIDNALNEKDFDAFGGPDDCHPSFSPLLKAINYSMTSFIGTGGTRGSSKSVTKFYPRSFNMGIKREVFEKIGGMNKLRHGQDMEFSSRIYNAGFKVGLIADAVVFHKRRTNLKRFYKQIFNWGVARINLGKIDPKMLKPIHFAPAIIAVGVCLLPIFALFPLGKQLVIFVFSVWAGIYLFAFVQSTFKYKNLIVGLLSIVTLSIQVFAYGMGLLSGLWQSRKGKVAKGFTKNYYK